MLSAATDADTIDTTGMQPYERCASCHGLDGNSRASRFPRLAGQDPVYLKKQLTDFRTGRRTNDEGAMSIAETLTDPEVDTVARYFAEQSPSAMAGEICRDAALGRQIYLQGRSGVAACVSCHGATVRSALGAPLIDGQHADYLQKQLIDFKRDARRNDPDRAMHRIAAALTRDEIRAVVAFASRLPPEPCE